MCLLTFMDCDIGAQRINHCVSIDDKQPKICSSRQPIAFWNR